MGEKVVYDAMIQFFIVLIHLVLPIPMYFAKKREENRDLEQQMVISLNENNDIHDKNFISLVINYLMIFVIVVVYLNIFILNRWVHLFSTDKRGKNI